MGGEWLGVVITRFNEARQRVMSRALRPNKITPTLTPCTAKHMLVFLHM